MIPYFFIFSYISVLSLTPFVKQTRKFKPLFFVFCYFVLFLFAGLRHQSVGMDNMTYIEKFLDVPDLSYWLSGQFSYSFKSVFMEPGYVIYVAFIRMFTDDYLYLFGGVAFLSVSFSVHNYYRYSPYIFLTLLLFFVHTYLYRDLNQIRAAVACALGLYLIRTIGKKEYIKTLLVITVASLFHMGALAYIIVYVLSFFNITKKKLLAMLSISFAGGVIGVTSIMLAVMPNLGYVSMKVMNYSTSQYAEPVGLFDLTNIKNLFISISLLFFWNRLHYKVKYFEIMMLFLISGTSWRILFSDFGILAARVATFFSIVEVVLVPVIILAFKQKLLPTIIVVFYAFLTLYLNLFIKDGRFPYFLSIFGS